MMSPNKRILYMVWVGAAVLAGVALTGSRTYPGLNTRAPNMVERVAGPIRAHPMTTGIKEKRNGKFHCSGCDLELYSSTTTLRTNILPA